MGYRKDYERLTRRKVPREFTIHHINHDRNDCDILNLVALPNRLHIKYHQLYPKTQLTECQLMLPVNTDELFDMERAAQRLVEFIKIRQECLKYINYRNHLLGIEEKKYKGAGY